MALSAHHKGFPAFSNHCNLPSFFAVQIFKFIYVVNFVMVAFCSAAQFADFCFQSVFKGINRISVDDGGITDVICNYAAAFAVGMIREVAPVR